MSLAVILIVSVLYVGSNAQLTWRLTDDEAALCNDFTCAGFFHRPASSGKQKWVVYLEGGSLCYSSETCNRRYFQSHLRERFSTEVGGRNLYGDFDTALVWNETRAAGLPLTQVVNPYMTSVYCFRNETQFFSDSDNLSTEGRDILSNNCSENPAFCNHGHVLVPYCSSDLWLGSDNLRRNTSDFSSLLKEEPCDCCNQECFRYNPTSEDLQFTFRGQTIFRSVLKTLNRLYKLETASEIVLVGSSSGGIGVLSSAKWVSEVFETVNIKVIADSSWFINFHDNIVQQIATDVDQTFFSQTSEEACFDRRRGYPCCIFAQCLLVQNSQITELPYFPRNISLFVLTSLYDIFLLSIPVSELDAVSTVGLGLDFITTVGEYGGAMNTSVIETAIASTHLRSKFSYLATQCFQHVYLATSTLQGLLGPGDVDFRLSVAEFR